MPAEAVVLDNFNEPLQLVARPLPEPTEGAVLADVLYAGVCGTDVHLHSGNMDIPTPLVLGHEAVGRVKTVGHRVVEDAFGQALRDGDVIGWASSIPCGECRACRAAEVTLCERRQVYGINQPWQEWPYFSGGWASAIYLRPGTTIARLPVSVAPLEAIALGCAGPTVVHGLDQIRGVSGDSVVIQGAGPVGIASALFARLRGAKCVVMIGGPTERITLARDLGVADAFVDLEVESEPRRRADLVRQLIGDDRGADVVIECTGFPDAVAEGIGLCRSGASYLVLGQYTDRGPTLINPHHITGKQLAVVGSWAFSPEDFLNYLRSLPDLLAIADLKQLVQVFPLSEADEALESVRRGRVLKAVLAPRAGLDLLTQVDD